MLDYTHDPERNVLSYYFNGKLDTTVSVEFKPAIMKLVSDQMQQQHERQLSVIFDFKSVDFITSAFVGVCVAAAKKAGKKNFTIINTNPFIKRTFKIAGLEEELNVS